MRERDNDHDYFPLPISDEGLRQLFEEAYREKEVFTPTDTVPLFSIQPNHHLDEAFEHDPHFD